MSARKRKPVTPKPHRMAFLLDEPCACGCEWGRPGVDVRPGVTEYELISLCAGCKARIPTAEVTP